MTQTENTMTVPVSEASPGDILEATSGGSMVRGAIRAVYPAWDGFDVEWGQYSLRVYVSQWETVEIRRPMPSAQEQFEELAIGTEFQVSGEGCTYVKVSDDLFARVPLKPGDNYLYGISLLGAPGEYLTTREPAPKPQMEFQPGDRVTLAPRKGSSIAHLAGLSGYIEAVHATQPRADDTLYIVGLDGPGWSRRYLFASELRREED